MSKIVGVLSYKSNLKCEKENIIYMKESISTRRNKDDSKKLEEFINEDINLIGDDFFKYRFNDNEYIVCLDGKIYNSGCLKEELKDNGFMFETNKDTELLIKCYIAYGEKMCTKLNGIYSFVIWDKNNKTLFMVRDRFGVKPFFYTKENNNFLFASEIKGLFWNKNVPKVIDESGLKMLIGLGPDRILGKTCFKNIMELKPASFLKIKLLDNNKTINGMEFNESKYWKLNENKHCDSLEKTAKKIRELLEKIVREEIEFNDINRFGALLSGGLDSSILVGITSNIYKEYNLGNLKTFSVKYKDNDKNFIPSEYEKSIDDEYINIMADKFGTKHRVIELDSPEIFSTLEDAVIAKDMPGMADIDTSMMCLAKYVKEDVDIAFSGECSDEIFGGYPWFFEKGYINNFPWSNAIFERENILNEKLRDKLNIKEYIKRVYLEEISSLDFINGTLNDENKNHKQKMYLTMNYFMNTLIERSDRMCMYQGLELRIPFCDYRLVEYLWNVPWNMKRKDEIEKGLLRYAFRDLLPEKIIYRKKSPYPKTFNPTYLSLVKEKLSRILLDDTLKINKIINKKYINEIINSNGNNFNKPWFGQLMKGPQFMAYLIELSYWLEKYNIMIDI